MDPRENIKNNRSRSKVTIITVVAFFASLATIGTLFLQWQQTKRELTAVQEARKNAEADVSQKQTALAIAGEQRDLQATMVVSGNDMIALQATLIELNKQQSTVAPELPTVPIPPTSTPIPPTAPVALPPSPTSTLILVAESGAEKVVLANKEDNIYTWDEGSPYLTTQFVYEGNEAFIPTGNNHFSKELGVIGYEQGEVRYLTFKLYLLKQDAALLLQVQTSDRNWEHRWGFDGRSTFQGYGWRRMGQMVNLPVGEWIDVRLDLINDLGATPGEKLLGLAFSGTDGNMVFDRVTLVSDH